MPTVQPDSTISAISNKVFMTEVLGMTYDADTPTVAIMSSKNLTPKRQRAADQLIPMVNSQTGAIESLKAPMSGTKTAGSGPLLRSTSTGYTPVDFEASQNDTDFPLNFDVTDYIAPYQIASMDVDVHSAPAKDYPNAVKAVVNAKMKAYKAHMIAMNKEFYAATHVANHIPPFTTDIAASGSCGGITTANEASWVSPVKVMGGQRLTIDVFSEFVREQRNRFGGSYTVAFMGFAVQNFLVREAQARWANAFSAKPLQEIFTDKDGKQTVSFESSISVWTIDNCVLIADVAADTADPTRVNVISPESYIYGAVTNNPNTMGGQVIHGPQNVLLSTGIPAIRGAAVSSLYNACLNRTHQLAFTGCAI